MDLFITHCFSRRVIGTTRFLESQPITPAEAMSLLCRSRDVALSCGNQDEILGYIRDCTGH